MAESNQLKTCGECSKFNTPQCNKLDGVFVAKSSPACLYADMQVSRASAAGAFPVGVRGTLVPTPPAVDEAAKESQSKAPQNRADGPAGEVTDIPAMAALKAAMEPDKYKPMDLRNTGGTLGHGRPIWETDPRFLNPFDEMPEITAWAKMGDRMAFPAQGIVTISAKPKQGKSFATYAIIQALLKGEPFDTLTPQKSPERIIVFDAEMSKITLTQRTRAFCISIGEDGLERIGFMSLMGATPAERRDQIEDIIKERNPDIVIIDQVAKLAANVNDPVEAEFVGNWLNNLSRERTIFAVIHKNKAKDDNNMTGRLGTILEQLAVENYDVKKEDGVIKVIPVSARDTEAEGAKPFTFALDGEGRIIDPKDLLKEADEKKKAGFIQNFDRLFEKAGVKGLEIRSDQLNKLIQEEEGLQKDAARDKVSNAVSAGALIKRKVSSHEVYYSVAS